jgi:hypothetical protein
LKKIYALTGLVLFFFMISGCQTLDVREAEAPTGPAGVYLAKTSTPNGEIAFTLTINSDGTGSTESDMGKSEFKDAKIEGKDFAFDMNINSQMGEMQLAFKGSVEGDGISGTIETQMGEMAFTGQRK